MSRITRRGCLLAIAGAPVVLGIKAQTLLVRLDGEVLRISAPNLHFLTAQALDRLKNGNVVAYLAQLTISTGDERTVRARAAARFAFSSDIWENSDARIQVTLITPQSKPKVNPRKLTAAGAEAWCLDQLKIDLAQIPAGRPFWVRLEMRAEEPKNTDGIIGEPGISITGLVALFSHPPKKQQAPIDSEEGPFSLSDLRRARL